jgi:hypothetical protein
MAGKPVLEKNIKILTKENLVNKHQWYTYETFVLFVCCVD